MKQSLKELEERNRYIINNILDVIVEVNTKGKFIYFSPQVYDLFGFRSKELTGLNSYNFIHPEDLSHFREVLDKVLKFEESLTIELRVKHKKGYYVPVSLKSNLVKNKGIIKIIGIIRDITERKNFEQQLKESEKKYRNILENVTKGYYETDLRGNLIYANVEHCKILGYSKEEVIGKDYRLLYDTKSCEVFFKIFNQVYKTGIPWSPTGIVKVMTLKKKVIYLEELVDLLYDSEGNKVGFYGVSRDITERKFAEQKLNESEEKYRNILENMMEIYYETDLRGNHVYVNAEYCKTIGYSKEEVIGKDFHSLYDAKSCEVLFNLFNQVYKTGIPWPPTNEAKLMTLKKKLIYFEGIIDLIYDSEGNKVGFYGLIRDITDRKIAEQKLKESEEKYRNILENMMEGYYEVDLDNNIIFFNDSFIKILGYSAEKVLYENYGRFMDDDNKKKVSQHFNTVYKTEKPVIASQFEIINIDGEIIWVESSVYLKRDTRGNKIGFGGLLRDISERKKIDEMRKEFTVELKNEVIQRTRELNEALKKQEFYIIEILKSSRFKNEFMSIMSHELRTPMNSIIGFSDLLIEGSFGQLNKAQEDFICDINGSANHLLSMINHVLDISKIESGKLEMKIKKIQLNTFIKQVKGTLKSLYDKKNLTFELIGLKENKFLNVDSIRFREILFNLLSNAIKFTLKGTITLKISEDEESWKFDVIDTGIGIAKENFDLIFLDFTRINDPYVNLTEGTGLGLSVTKRLVELHAGCISFTSELGKGSTFSFTIPKNLKEV